MPNPPTVSDLLSQLEAAIRAEYRQRILASLDRHTLGSPNGTHKPATPRRTRPGRAAIARPGKYALDSDRVLSAIRRSPSPIRSEVLARGLHVEAKVLRPVLAELVRARKVKRTGNRRSTAYEAR